MDRTNVMDFDWSDPPFNAKDAPTLREVEESFEDPFSLRLIPDAPRFTGQSRTFCLGRTLAGRGIFSVYRTDGKKIRVIATRPMTEEEDYMYDRKVQEYTT